MLGISAGGCYSSSFLFACPFFCLLLIDYCVSIVTHQIPFYLSFEGSLPLLPLSRLLLTWSLLMPTRRHLLNLQCWHLFLVLLSMVQALSERQE